MVDLTGDGVGAKQGRCPPRLAGLNGLPSLESLYALLQQAGPADTLALPSPDPSNVPRTDAGVYCVLALGPDHDPRGMTYMAAARYFTTVGPVQGPILWRDGFGAIGVYLTLDPEPNRPHMPIGSMRAVSISSNRRSMRFG